MSAGSNADAGNGSLDGVSGLQGRSTSPPANPTSTSSKRTGKSSADPNVMAAGVLRVGVSRKDLRSGGNVSSKRKCIIVDIDGTVALMGKGQEGRRGPYDWDRVGEDDPNEPVIELLWLIRCGRSWLNHSPFSRLAFTIIFVSGRKEQCRQQTWAWLRKNGVVPDLEVTEGYQLLMRGDNDNRPDHELKLEILEQQILPRYDVMFVIDDRDAVVKMWRAQGLTCLQVAEGGF
jgi:hypothetical protein